ncbi:MAG TPA: penicillin-binding protein 2 [Parvularculaceae bacterium]|nr:penicillin-binding protein 2 [Caulobacterales bacterium]HPE30257.1 penicillin-binding protein 2 [Parvularculaceae bacterium]
MARINSHDPERLEILSRRAFLFGSATTAAFAGIVGRLYQLQIADHDKYVKLAMDNQFNTRILTPLRGEILDRFGNVLASNRKNFRVLLMPDQTRDVEGALDKLAHVIELSPEKRDRLLRQIKRGGRFTPVEVQANLSWDEFAKLNYELPELPGAMPDVGETRDYPLGSAAAFVIGYVGAVTEEDLKSQETEADRVLLRQPGFKVGRDGLERTYDKELRGESGKMDVKVNAYGRVIEEVADRATPPTQGQTLVLTIDADLQQVAMRELEGESGAAVVLDVHTGDVLVLASTPAFDPNDFNVGINPDLWRELNSDPRHPLLNKPLGGVYPPGSTFKTISSIAAQIAGVKTSFSVSCSGKMWYGNRYFHCWKRGGHGGGINMRNAIKHSCDTYFYTVAKDLEIDIIADVAKKLGLGQTFELGIPGQKRGVVPSREWKRAYFAGSPQNQPWFQGETLSVIIGQGYVTATPLQLAVMAARIATGKEVRPRIVRMRGALDLPPQPFGNLDIDQSYFDVVRAGMSGVVNEPGGTAFPYRPTGVEWAMGGKSGSSQVYQISAEDRARGLTKQEELPWERRDHALFVSFAPFDNPRYACAVIVEHGIGGSRMAGGKTSAIMKAVMEKDPATRPAFDPRSLAQVNPQRQEG